MQKITALYCFWVEIRTVTDNDIFAFSIPIFPKHNRIASMKIKLKSDILRFSTQKLGNAWIKAALTVSVWPTWGYALRLLIGLYPLLSPYPSDVRWSRWEGMTGLCCLWGRGQSRFPWLRHLSAWKMWSNPIVCNLDLFLRVEFQSTWWRQAKHKFYGQKLKQTELFCRFSGFVLIR